MTLACLLIADDLTGACDAAVQFAVHGLRTRVALCPGEATVPVDVLAFNTESRDAPLGSFGESLASLPDVESLIIFKKIDSTLRGNVGAEVAAARDHFGCQVAIVTPAFPAMGRLVDHGHLKLPARPDFVPCEVAACFRGLPGSFVVRDAVCDADLDAVAQEGLACGQRVLWAGSAGLAAALARAIAKGPPPAMAFSPGAPVFCLGSDHPVTWEQQRFLRENRPESTVLRMERGEDAGRLRDRLANRRAPLVLSGGDTAALVCRALGVRAIDLGIEIVPGIPCGILRGGLWDGLPVVTKSGGFGRPDALMQVADFFSCFPQSH